MNILLDAKDLIDLIKYNRPVCVKDFSIWLQQKAGKLVLSYTNVSDFVGPDLHKKDFLEIRAHLQKLEILPITYFGDGLIIRYELLSALDAFQSKQEPLLPDLYVSRWDHTFIWKEKSEARMLVGLRLDDIVYEVREEIQKYKRFSNLLRQNIEWSRNLPSAKRQSKKDIFISNIPQRLKQFNIESHNTDLSAFCEWLWKKPQRCLGLRLQFEAYHQIENDRSMPLQDGDIADFTHFASLPYVDLLTVDKRIAHILKIVIQKLRSHHLLVNLSGKVFKNLRDLMDYCS